VIGICVKWVKGWSEGRWREEYSDDQGEVLHAQEFGEIEL
jgi:hypothetical protein